MTRKTHGMDLRLTAALLGALLCYGRPAAADPELRTQMDVRGNFVLLGANLAWECASDGPPAPTVGTVGTGTSCPNTNVAAPDIFWRADDPADGQARADSSITAAQARATAALELPDGATVVHARLYWGGLKNQNSADPQVRLDRADGSFDEMIDAEDEVVTPYPNDGSQFFYQSTADITELVIAQGEGPYRVGEVESILRSGAGQFGALAAWYMVVFYERPGEASRNLAIFDGLDFVQPGAPQSVTLTGFVVPDSGFDATLGVVAFEGEDQFAEDELTFNGSTLSNALNPANNFFNATRSRFGNPVSLEGDLPRLSGAARSYSNMDMDEVNVTTLVSGGDTSASIGATSSQLDQFLLSAFITSVSTLLPDFTGATLTVTDDNGGVPAPGDVLTYTFSITNDGSDASVETVLADVVPDGLTFVPGSIQIGSGQGAGDKTDAAGDDQAEYDDSTRTVTIRLGEGADADHGGKLAIGDSVEVSFKVTVDADTRGEVDNQGTITAAGEQGAPASDTPTDGDPDTPEAESTTVFVEECDTDEQCMDPTPFCDTTASPRECVGCTTDGQCDDPDVPDCNPDTNTCECAMGPGHCVDTDMDGSSDGRENEIGTDPLDADTDDDGVLDGDEIEPEADSDGDGVINALDPDSDNDALPDGLELGLGCDHPQTMGPPGTCRPDGDMGATTTDPTDPDTDDGGVSDGSEDHDLDGVIDPDETDPNDPSDDNQVPDMDQDGLGDELEDELHSDPNDPDTDDDGVRDGQEPDPATDGDDDGLVGVLDPDSDNDGLFDGTELGLGCSDAATDASLGHCRPDADMGATTTSPTDADTDDGGARDGSEDSNLNGAVDTGERDPTAGHGDDDAMVIDSDNDGLSDPLEQTLGTDPNDADSDDDGSPDGMEANPSDDHDGDGVINALDPDSDDDGLFDGTEQGRDCADMATDAARGNCKADADMGATTTSPVNPDTDFGGKPDGAEDPGADGRIDTGDTDPNDPSDDGDCTTDADCGDMQSGLICEDYMCVPGCRGTDGNGCPMGQVCTSIDGSAGMCEMPEPPPIFGGGGCKCDLSRGDRERSQRRAVGSLLALLVLGAGLWSRTRRR